LTLELSFTEKEKALVELNFDEVAYENIEKDILGTQDEISSIKEEKTDLGANIKIHENQIEFWNQEIKENEKLQEEIIDIENEMKLLTKLDEVYKDYRYDKLNKLAPALSDIMSGLMDRITEGKYDQVELDKDFNIHVYRQGIKNPLSFYSGGERKLAALTQRLAISNLLVAQTGQANFDMLAMDEVFGSMDNARQDNILDMLRNLNEMFSQILIVTHSENVKDGFDNILEIGQDENGFSKAKWETQWDVNETKEIIQQYERQFEFDIEEETADTAS
jgi:DNA repair exonuclease SbcCD ATPase subunit